MALHGLCMALQGFAWLHAEPPQPKPRNPTPALASYTHPCQCPEAHRARALGRKQTLTWEELGGCRWLQVLLAAEFKAEGVQVQGMLGNVGVRICFWASGRKPASTTTTKIVTVAHSPRPASWEPAPTSFVRVRVWATSGFGRVWEVRKDVWCSKESRPGQASALCLALPCEI